MVSRVVLGVEYDGSGAHGWQFQSHDPLTLQAFVEAALSKVADHPVKTTCAGRTDAGVHASQQVVHFDTHVERTERAWVMGSNRYLPPTVAIRWAKSVSDQFHARFSALSRRYRYIIYNSPVRQALLNRQLTWFYHPLDVERMDEAAQQLLGEHDFTSYRAVACQANNPVRQLRHIRLHKKGDLIYMDVEANGFLQHMVRNIMGVLLKIGVGDRPIEWAADVLAAKDRTQGGVTAPPYGLYFLGPQYEAHFKIPQSDHPIPVFPI